jgi:hypothetical protein
MNSIFIFKLENLIYYYPISAVAHLDLDGVEKKAPEISSLDSLLVPKPHKEKSGLFH